jgi:hypothetical protein
MTFTLTMHLPIVTEHWVTLFVTLKREEFDGVKKKTLNDVLHNMLQPDDQGGFLGFGQYGRPGTYVT